MKILKKIWNAIATPFQSIHAICVMSKEENLDGSWDKYWQKKNKEDR